MPPNKRGCSARLLPSSDAVASRKPSRTRITFDKSPMPPNKRRCSARLLPSSDAVASSSDILIAIFSLLPFKSLCRFKAVSKHGRSLISDLKLPPTSLTPSALFLELRTIPYDDLPVFEFVSLTGHNPNKPSRDQNPRNFIPEPSGIRIASSCNGLFCCFNLSNRNYYMYNPTTKQFKKLPSPGCGGVSQPVHGVVNLAFDPSKSRHYKIVCVRYLDADLEPRTRKPEGWFEWYRAEVYSSESDEWVLSGEPFEASLNTYFNRGVFWKGSIHWVNGDSRKSLYFDIDKEMVREMYLPRVPDGNRRSEVSYFGESLGHLHLIEIYDQKCAKFDVYEMEMDYSQWFVKYRVDLDLIPVVVEEMNRGYNFVPLLVVQGDIDEESFLVLLINGKLIRYDFEGKTFKKLCDFGPVKPYKGYNVDGFLLYGGWLSAFPFIESFSWL